MAVPKLKAVGTLLHLVHGLPARDRRKFKAAAEQAQAGDSRPLIDLLKKLVSDPELLAMLIKLLPLILPLIVPLL